MAGFGAPQYNAAMRIVSIVLMGVLLTGCSSLLLGGGGQSDSTPRTSTGAAATSADDRSISSSIRVAFERDEDIREYAIGVGTSNRVVTLSGTVGSYAVRDRAVSIARETAGVSSVRNRIVVNTNM